MAVAADFHRDFLIPEHTVGMPDSEYGSRIQVPSVYSFVLLL